MDLRALLAACALAACSSTPAELPPPDLPQRAGVDPLVAARAEGVTFQAHGPAFELQFYADRITLTREHHAPQSFPRPEPRYPRWNGEIYETSNASHALTVHVRHDRPCPGEPGRRAVRISLDGAEMHGCGRRL